MALLLILGALAPGAWATVRLDSIGGQVAGGNVTAASNQFNVWTNAVNATNATNTNVTILYNKTAAADGVPWTALCTNASTAITNQSDAGIWNFSCSFSGVPEGPLNFKAALNFTSGTTPQNSTAVLKVGYDASAPVTNASSIVLSGGVRLRPGSNRTISVIATDTNFSVSDCTLFVNPDYPNGQTMTQDTANTANFSFSWTPNWAGWGEAWVSCNDYHTRGTGLTTRVAFEQAGGTGFGAYQPTIPAPDGVQAASSTPSFLAGTVSIGTKTVPKWFVLAVVGVVVYFAFFDKKKKK